MALNPARYAAATAALLATVLAPDLLAAAVDPARSDFGNYFASAWKLRSDGSLAGAYDRETFLGWLHAAGISRLGSFVPQPPVNALWLWPLAGLHPVAAKAVWTGGLIAAAVALFRLLGALFPRVEGGWRALAILAPVDVFRNGVAFGQPYLLVALLVAAGARLAQRGSWCSGAFAIGVAAGLKPQAAPLVLLFCGRDRRAILSVAAFAAGAIAPFVVLAGLGGGEAIGEFQERIAPRLLRAEIQDPFSPVWGSPAALLRGMLRAEPDLNPHPLIDAPRVAEGLWVGLSALILAVGAVCARRLVAEGDVAGGAGVLSIASLAAAPLGASYHLALTSLGACWLLGRSGLRVRCGVIALLFLAGSPAAHAFLGADGVQRPLAFLRLWCLLGVLAVAPRAASAAAGSPWRWIAAWAGAAAGLALLANPVSPAPAGWTRLGRPGEYSRIAPHFCGGVLGWWAPTRDGRALESRSDDPRYASCGARREVAATGWATSQTRPERVRARFERGSWNLFVSAGSGTEIRLTDDAGNEVDPVWTPDGNAIVFASDRGRGLESFALYRLAIPSIR